MGDEWDADDFEPTSVTSTLLTTVSNKWEGEDEEDNIKESWEDEEEEKKDEEKREGAPPPKSKNRRLAEKIAQKEREMEEERERKLAEEEASMTPEQRAQEKIRKQRMQEEADLKVALDTFGISDGTVGSLDSYNPTTKEEFDEFSEALTNKISSYKEKVEYVDFVTGLVKNIVLHMPSGDIRNLKAALENLYLEKSKLEKGDKAKKSNKGKGKAKLMVETDVTKQYSGFGDYDYDDFM